MKFTKKEEKRDIAFWDANLLKKPIFKFKKIFLTVKTDIKYSKLSTDMDLL